MSVSGDTVRLGGKPYTLIELGGRRAWIRRLVPSQPGEVGPETVIPINDAHLGLAISVQNRGPGARPVAGVEEADNFEVWDGRWRAAPSVTIIDATSSHRQYTDFRIGGFDTSAIGGADGAGAIGGGNNPRVAQWIRQYGDSLYVGFGSYIATIDPDGQTVDEARELLPSGDTRSATLHDAQLVVAAGGGHPVQIATNPRGGAGQETTWVEATVNGTLFADAVSTGRLGRLYSGLGNRVKNAAAGADLANFNNHQPLVGEALGDSSFGITAIAEWLNVMVGAKTDGLHHFALDGGFHSRTLLASLGVPVNDCNGRGLFVVGDDFFYPTSRALYWSAGGKLVPIGPEIIPTNESRIRGGEWGQPAFDGFTWYWPYFIDDPTPANRISYIIKMRKRLQGEPGFGLFVLQAPLRFNGIEIRTAFFWAGNDSTLPRLFFGYGSDTIPERIAWIPRGRGGAPDYVDAGGTPVIAGSVTGPADDRGLPNTTKQVVRVELPRVRNSDGSNYFGFDISFDKGVSYEPLRLDADDALTEKLFAQAHEDRVLAFPARGTVLEGELLKWRLRVVQEAAAGSYVELEGYPAIYVVIRASHIDQIDATFRFRDTDDRTAREQFDDLALEVGNRLLLEDDPDGGEDITARVVAVTEAEENQKDREGDRRQRVAQVTLLQVLTRPPGEQL